MSTAATTLEQLAALVEGHVCGNPSTLIHGAAVLGEVQPGQITLVDQPERIKQLESSQAAAVVLPDGLTVGKLPSIAVADVHDAFTKIVLHFRPPRQEIHTGISPAAVVSPTARLATDVSVHPGATIGDDVEIGSGTRILPGAHVMAGCVLGRDVTVGPAAVLYENTVVGDRSVLHAGVVLGAHGFGYRQVDGRHEPAAQLGYVQIGTDVEIGANSALDRGTYGATTVGDGTKIDNLVQIAHNCRIGRHNLICSQVGIAGSTTTGDYVVMGGQAGIRDHVHIGTGAILSAMAGVSNDVPDGAVMMGIPATPERAQKLKQAALAKLPEMRKEFKAMRRTIAELERVHAAQSTDAGHDRSKDQDTGRAA